MARHSKREESTEQPAAKPAAAEMSESLRTAFENAAMNVATRTALAIDNVKEAYQDKPESLTVIWDKMQQEKSDLNSWIGWSVAWVILLPPIALYTGYQAWESYNNLENLQDQVKAEVANATSAPKRQANGPDAAL